MAGHTCFCRAAASAASASCRLRSSSRMNLRYSTVWYSNTCVMAVWQTCMMAARRYIGAPSPTNATRQRKQARRTAIALLLLSGRTTGRCRRKPAGRPKPSSPPHTDLSLSRSIRGGGASYSTFTKAPSRPVAPSPPSSLIGLTSSMMASGSSRARDRLAVGVGWLVEG